MILLVVDVLCLIVKHCFAVWMTLPSGWWMPTCMLLFYMLLSLAAHRSSASQELCCKRPRMPSFLSPVTTSSRVSVSVAVALCKHTHRVAQKSKLLILCIYIKKLKRYKEQIRTTTEKMKHCWIFSHEIFLSVLGIWFSIFKFCMTECSQCRNNNYC